MLNGTSWGGLLVPQDKQNMIKALYNVTLENFLTQQVECPSH